MTLPRLAVILSVATVIAWAAKAVAIGGAGGLGRSPAEGPLFLTGFVAFVLGAVVLGVALSRRRGGWIGAVLGVGAVVVLAASTAGAQLMALALEPEQPGWAWGEVNLWVGASVLLLLAIATWRSATRQGVVSASRDSVSVT